MSKGSDDTVRGTPTEDTSKVTAPSIHSKWVTRAGKEDTDTLPLEPNQAFRVWGGCRGGSRILFYDYNAKPDIQLAHNLTHVNGKPYRGAGDNTEFTLVYDGQQVPMKDNFAFVTDGNIKVESES